jgi:hypothetical protein
MNRSLQASNFLGDIKHSDRSMKFEDSIARDLTNFGFEGFVKKLSPLDGFESKLLEINFAWREQNVALLCDHSFKFLINLDTKTKEDHFQDGQTKSKTRILTGMGWKVLRLSASQVSALGDRTEEERRSFWIEWLK